jgi:hypothetical protein
MANPFKGYLIKSVASGKIFPNEYINYESWESNPNQREEIKAYREENSRDLHRITASGRKTALKFDTRPNLHLADIRVIKKWFSDAESNADERKMDIEFWDDDKSLYREITVYRANPKFKIKKITDDDIIYLSQTVDLIEY